MAKRKTSSSAPAGKLTKTAQKIAKDVLRDQTKKNPRHSGWLAFIILIGCILGILYDQFILKSDILPSSEENQSVRDETLTGGILTLAPGTYRVKRVIDGDTLLLDGASLGASQNPRIRLLGVNTPETVKQGHPVEPFGPEASAYTKSRIEQNQFIIRLEFDEDPTDKYGRFLGYIWLGESLLNEELLRHGLGKFEGGYSYFPEMRDRFIRAQQAAQQEQRGIWSLK
ncbi:MAG: thermonuclease family protein [Planctomycetia bacterium]|nr:thermonuclease family protein [Planctomycetia bacterium]